MTTQAKPQPRTTEALGELEAEGAQRLAVVVPSSPAST